MADHASSPGVLTVSVAAEDPEVDDAVDEGDSAFDEVGHVEDDGDTETAAGQRIRWSALRHPSAVVGRLGFQTYQERKTQIENGEYLQAARQGALNLTTIDWQHAEDAVKRILDSATGEFYDDFQLRSSPFVEVVKQAQSVSTGAVTGAALESHSASEAQALVAVSVQTSDTTGTEPVPRAWRMRISVQKLDGQMKISRVEFVP